MNRTELPKSGHQMTLSPSLFLSLYVFHLREEKGNKFNCKFLKHIAHTRCSFSNFAHSFCINKNQIRIFMYEIFCMLCSQKYVCAKNKWLFFCYIYIKVSSQILPEIN